MGDPWPISANLSSAASRPRNGAPALMRLLLTLPFHLIKNLFDGLGTEHGVCKIPMDPQVEDRLAQQVALDGS